MEQKKIRIGKIVNCHGIKGELVLLQLTDDNGRFKKLKRALLELPGNGYEEVEIQAAREHKGNILLTVAGVDTRNKAERLKNLYLCVNPEDAVKPKGAYFIYEIVGLNVYENDVYRGKVTAVLQNSSTDLYEVQHEAGVFYLPALKSVVKCIDLEKNRMDVEIPEGLLD